MLILSVGLVSAIGLGSNTAYGQADDNILQTWKDYIESYKQYMEKYKQWAYDRFANYDKIIEFLKNENINLKNEIINLKSDMQYEIKTQSNLKSQLKQLKSRK